MSEWKSSKDRKEVVQEKSTQKLKLPHNAISCREKLFDSWTNHIVTDKRDDIAMLCNASYLSKALKDNRFIIYFQPKINLHNNACIGAEALIRFRDTQGKIIAPNRFISLLENTFLISRIYNQKVTSCRKWTGFLSIIENTSYTPRRRQ